MLMRGSETEKCLLKAFSGESQARNRYTYFSSQARNERLMQISAIFAETADQEKEHAKRFFRYLEGGTLEITASFPAGVIGDTRTNLLAAASGEYDEWHNLYPSFAAVAERDGFDEVAETFLAICKSEEHHEKRYRALERILSSGHVFQRDTPVVWVCANCGYVHEGLMAPESCPACRHPQGYFKKMNEDF